MSEEFPCCDLKTIIPLDADNLVDNSTQDTVSVEKASVLQQVILSSQWRRAVQSWY
jgi:hypothetical protein